MSRRDLKKSLKRGILLAAVFAAAACRVRGGSFEVDVMGRRTTIQVNHAGLAANLITPAIPGAPGFGPPTIFSAPLPTGSGARALGLAGAFTAVADDATAASWNPGGLTQLERPEASAVARYTREANEHRSGNRELRVGEDTFDGAGLNYFSLVWPFRFAHRNWVFSANYQEAYDFTQKFTADLSGVTVQSRRQAASGTFRERSTRNQNDGTVDLDVMTDVTTETTSVLNQLLQTDLVSDLAFEQEGVLSAISPALAVQLTPKLSLGTAVNIYQHDLTQPGPIRSRTRANYSGTTLSRATITTTRSSSGTYSYEGVVHLPAGGGLPPVDIPVPETSGAFPPFTDTETRTAQSRYVFEGTYEEENEYDDLCGVNATLGMLWTVNRYLGVGLSVDLPWTAAGRQTRHIRNSVTTYNQARTAAVGAELTEERITRDIDFHFPLYWSAGALWRWSNRLYTTLDVSETLWSDFWYRADGVGKINPLDGSPYGQNRIDDCWAVRAGVEYLCVLSWTEIPLRGGVSWEQRPAVGAPDEYWGVSLGSGISLGRDPGRVILDAAYLYTWGDDVLGSLVPGPYGLRSDVTKHQGYVSCIWHF